MLFSCCSTLVPRDVVLKALSNVPWEALLEEATMVSHTSQLLTAEHAHTPSYEVRSGWLAIKHWSMFMCGSHCFDCLLPSSTIPLPVCFSGNFIQDASFLGLPRELRDMIYDHWLVENPRIILNTTSLPTEVRRDPWTAFTAEGRPSTTFAHGFAHRQKGLFTVNHQVRNELLSRYVNDRRIRGLHAVSSPLNAAKRYPIRCHVFTIRTSFLAVDTSNSYSLNYKHITHFWLCLDDVKNTSRRSKSHFFSVFRGSSYTGALASIARQLRGMQDLKRFEIEWTRLVDPPPPMTDNTPGLPDTEPKAQYSTPAAIFSSDTGGIVWPPPGPESRRLMPIRWSQTEYMNKQGYIVGWEYGHGKGRWKSHQYARSDAFSWSTGTMVDRTEPIWSVDEEKICFDGMKISTYY